MTGPSAPSGLLVAPAGGPSLGRSLALDGGDLVFDDDGGDLMEVEQLSALSQALRLSIATQLGTDRLNAQFGFDRLAIGAFAYGLHTRKEFVKMQLVRCAGLDQRVRDVREVFFSDDPRAFELQPGLDAETQERIVSAIRASRDYTVVVVVETITSQSLTVEAEGTLG
jgi:hypothetical protein